MPPDPGSVPCRCQLRGKETAKLGASGRRSDWNPAGHRYRLQLPVSGNTGCEVNGRRRHIFRIEGLSKETIAMRDLAAYLTDLAELVGHHESVHFQEVREGSVVVAYDVDSLSVEHVTCRLLDACHETGDAAARSAYLSLNQRLRRDRSSGTILEQSETDWRTLVDIPGVLEEAGDRFPVLWEAGTVDGTPTGVGGRRLDPDWVSVRLDDSGNPLSCEARPPIAIEIAHHLLTTPIRARGKGRWIHDDQGWRLDKFRIEHFDPLDARPMAELVGEMRELYAETDWARVDDPIGQLDQLRKDG